MGGGGRKGERQLGKKKKCKTIFLLKDPYLQANFSLRCCLQNRTDAEDTQERHAEETQKRQEDMSDGSQRDRGHRLLWERTTMDIVDS